MRELDRMLIQARKLDILTREYTPVCILSLNSTGGLKGNGTNQTFDSEEDATRYYKKQAAGRPVVFILDDIPRPDLEQDPHDVACFSPLKFVEGGEEE